MVTAKKTTDKSTKSKAADKENSIKYSDKSKGQPELIPIFEALTFLMKPFVKGAIKVNNTEPGMYNMVSKKPVEVAGRKFDELFFAGAMIQKGFVGFYYFPVYVNSEMKKQLKPELLKCLKGKTCFHIKKNDPEIFRQVQEALQIGYKMYEDRGWV